jgi:transcription antitermination factor NusG
MAQTKKLNIKVGDQVTIISGFHKNETGEVIKVEKKNAKSGCSRN